MNDRIMMETSSTTRATACASTYPRIRNQETAILPAPKVYSARASRQNARRNASSCEYPSHLDSIADHTISLKFAYCTISTPPSFLVPCCVALAAPVLAPSNAAIFGICSTLGNLSDSLLRFEGYPTRPSRTETYTFSGDGTRLMIGPSGGRHAAKRPMETSIVVQNDGGVRSGLLALSEGGM